MSKGFEMLTVFWKWASVWIAWWRANIEKVSALLCEKSPVVEKSLPVTLYASGNDHPQVSEDLNYGLGGSQHDLDLTWLPEWLAYLTSNYTKWKVWYRTSLLFSFGIPSTLDCIVWRCRSYMKLAAACSQNAECATFGQRHHISRNSNSNLNLAMSKTFTTDSKPIWDVP